MNWLSKRLHSVRLIFTISLVLTVSLSNNLAGAQQMCAGLFDGPSYGIALQELNESTSVLFSKFSEPSTLTVEQLEQGVRQIERSTEAFLTAAGIVFDSATISRPTPEVKDRTDYVLKYKVYELKGSQNGSPIARMIHGALMHPEAKGRQLTFALDPLYVLNYKDSSALFLVGLKTIMLGPHEFTENLVATGADLRHEIQHFFEQIKMLKGENTLARVELASVYGREDVIYSDKFRADEIETHLRDIRFLSNTAQNKNVDPKLAELGYTPEYFPKVKAYRESVIAQKKEFLQHFLIQTREAVATIEAHLEGHKLWYKKLVNPENGDITLSFFGTGHYGDVKVNLNGLVKGAEINDNAKIREALVETLKWSNTRMDTIDRELKILEARKK